LIPHIDLLKIIKNELKQKLILFCVCYSFHSVGEKLCLLNLWLGLHWTLISDAVIQNLRKSYI